MMRGSKYRNVQVAVLAALSIAALAASEARGAFPGGNGKIVFRTNRDGNAEIYTMNADGTNRVDLSRNPAEDVDPRWSPDGTRIVFASNLSGSYQIYTMNADGSDVAQLTQLGTDSRRPTWAADGSILFQSGSFGSRAIYRMNADGSGLTQITPSTSDNAYPAASPRGDRIAFSSLRTGSQQLYTMTSSGGAVQPVTPAPSGSSDVEANWSPRGNDLVFARFDSSNGSDLYAVHTDGSDLRQLTNTPDRVEFEPAWSPDGTKIAFHACSALGTPHQRCAIYTMNADGSGETEISTPRAPYIDTFSGDRVDPFWGSFVEGTGPTLAEMNGRLEVSVPSDTLNDPSLGYTSLGVAARCDLLGDFDVQVDYELLEWPPASGVNVDFDTFDVINGNYGDVYGMFVFDPGSGTGVSTHFPGPINTFVPAPEPSGTLRFVRVGTTLTAYRLTTAGWGPLQSITDSANEKNVSLNVFSNAAQFSHPDVKIAYDNFRVSSGTFSCPSWWDDSAPDWQPSP
jgi:Tol biopolymer transport system component